MAETAGNDDESDTEVAARAARAAAHRARAQWIARHVLPQEPDLRRVLGRRAPAGFEVDDLIQEIYARLAAAPSVDHIDNPRAYVFRMASGITMDFLRRSKVAPIVHVEQLDAVGAATQEPSPETIALDRDQLRRLARVFAELPPKVAAVFRLRRVEGLSQRETAHRLGIAESTVEKHMAKGVYLIAQGFEPEARPGGNVEVDATKKNSWKLSRRRAPR